MTQIKRRLGDYATSRFLNSKDVTAGGEGPAVITQAAEQEVRDDRSESGKRLAILIYFDRFPDKGYDCNTTNIRALQDMFGEDVAPDDLRGQRVWLGTHDTNFGRGILISAIQGTVSDNSAEARQRIANARSVAGEPEIPLVSLKLTHNHDPAFPCANDCKVARAKQIGHPVEERWPSAGIEVVVPPQLNGPPTRPVASGDDAAPGEYRGDDPGTIAAPPSDDDIPF